MALGPATWGPYGWKFLHFVTMGYPANPTNEHKENYKNFFQSLGNILPCSVCSNNYKKHLVELPLTNDILNNRDKLIKWMIDIHNIVNKETGKPSMSYDDALANIINTNKHSGNKLLIEQNTNIFEKHFLLYILILILLILVIIAVIYKKK
jgi:hypothetical protein